MFLTAQVGLLYVVSEVVQSSCSDFLGGVGAAVVY